VDLTAATSERRRAGIALCLLSACGFGLMAIFAVRAYDAGVGVTTLLAWRFVLAATVFWAIVGVRRRSAKATRRVSRPPRGAVLAAFALGVGYSCQAGFFFSALRHIDASLTSLLLYTFPAIVCCAAVLLGRERFTAVKAMALALASGGLALVLLGGGSGGLQVTGVLLGLGAGIAYSVYILAAEGVVGRIDAWTFSALVCTGAALTLLTTGAVTGSLALTGGWIWIVAIALLSTVLPISTFLLGIERVGSSTASIVSTVEPVVTVSLAVVVLGEVLAAAQVLGAAFVLAAVVVLASPPSARRASFAIDGPAPEAPGRAPARASARDAA
jgi:drug/metabolite transporter (DMT)-like permease